MEKEMLWKIIQGEVSMPVAMDYLGFLEQESSDVITKIGQTDKEFAFGHFALGTLLSKLAYKELVNLGELNGTTIYNISTKSFEENSEIGDIGFCGDKTYRYATSGWEQIY